MPVVKYGSERDQAKKSKDSFGPRNPDGSQYAKPASKSKHTRPS